MARFKRILLKIKFQLKDYNVEEEAVESIDDNTFSTYDYDR